MHFNQTFMQLLHHVICDHSRDWDKHVSVRESVNITIRLSPYLRLYGHLPSNRLSLFKQASEGQCNLPQNLGKSDTKYLNELCANLVTVHSYAKQHAEKAQTNRQNITIIGLKRKALRWGDKVAVLHGDSTSKLRGQ